MSPVHSRAEVPPLSSYPGPSPVLSEMPSESTATPCYWEGRPTCLVCPRNLHLVCAPKAGHALTTSPRLHRPCGPVQQQEQWLQSASGPGRTLPGGHNLMKVLRSWPWTQHSPCNSTLTLQARALQKTHSSGTHGPQPGGGLGWGRSWSFGMMSQRTDQGIKQEGHAQTELQPCDGGAEAHARYRRPTGREPLDQVHEYFNRSSQGQLWLPEPEHLLAGVADS